MHPRNYLDKHQRRRAAALHEARTVLNGQGITSPAPAQLHAMADWILHGTLGQDEQAQEDNR